MKRVTQTAGHDQMGSFAPAFAHYNDDVLFGENWNDPSLEHKQRCLLTVVALVSSGVTDSPLTYHLNNAKAAGVTRQEIAGALTHIAFYVGWPKAWAAFYQARDVWGTAEQADAGNAGAADDSTSGSGNGKEQHAASMVFPIGEPNDAYAGYFSGQSYLAPVCTGALPVFNVTFEPGCKNNWHIHHADNGGGQVLICVGGRGYYQAWGEERVELQPGDSVTIPAGVKHWHGAAGDSWFSHLAIEVPGTNNSNEWLEPVAFSDTGAGQSTGTSQESVEA